LLLFYKPLHLEAQHCLQDIICPLVPLAIIKYKELFAKKKRCS
jgi:hypothetical protein